MFVNMFVFNHHVQIDHVVGTYLVLCILILIIYDKFAVKT